MLDTIGKLGEQRSSGVLPLELVQLDDGWQSQWGDWTTPHASRFPNGLAPVSAAAKAAGLLAGLWIAPAALTSNSRLMAEHPEWVLKGEISRPRTPSHALARPLTPSRALSRPRTPSHALSRPLTPLPRFLSTQW